ncbi:MAG TPA: hypothetical protein DD640_06245 [Clostridiales bacterium]|nr:hypothetical protein [Clostridiales bacterium]
MSELKNQGQEQEIIVLDVGGSFIKRARFSADNSADCSTDYRAACLVNRVLEAPLPIRESGSCEEILTALFACVEQSLPADCVCLSTPGPMDFTTATSHMKHKFKSLEGFSLKAALEERFAGIRFCFVHDGVAFLLGELQFGGHFGGQFSGCAAGMRLAGVMLGTGLGFAMSDGCRVLVNASRTPAWPLWDTPYREGIAENYVSGSALRTAYARAANRDIDVQEIAERARAGDLIAAGVFTAMGEALGEMLAEHVRKHDIDAISLGGQISKSAPLFIGPVRSRLNIPVAPTSHPDDAALYGAYYFARHGESCLKQI